MASVQKVPGRRYWYAFYRDAKGVQHCKSTRITHDPVSGDTKERGQKTAEHRRLALDMANHLEEVERGHPTEAHLRKLLADISTRVNGRRLEFAATSAYLNRWIERCAASRSAGTVTRYRGTVEAFLNHLGTKAASSIGDITGEDIEGFIAKRLAEGRNATSIQVDAKTLNIPFAVALRQGLILHNPVAAAPIPKGVKETRLPFSGEQLSKLLAVASHEWKTTILVGAYTGLRLGDAAGIKWGSLDLKEGLLLLRPAKTARKKRDLVIPLHPALVAHLGTMTPGSKDSHLSPNLARMRSGGKSGLSTQFAQLMKKAGILSEVVEAAGSAGRKFHSLSFHSLRHTFVARLANANVPADIRHLLAGHSSAEAHARYAHISTETLRSAISKIP